MERIFWKNFLGDFLEEGVYIEKISVLLGEVLLGGENAAVSGRAVPDCSGGHLGVGRSGVA